MKKRKKSSRARGSFTHGRGAKKKARGKGHKGGKGMAGTGKRADQKKSLGIKLLGNQYFGKSKTLRKKTTKKLKVINLQQISENLKGYKKNSDSVINLKGYKILSQGNLTEKVVIVATAASKAAIEKIKKSGGEIKLEEKSN